MLPFTHSTPFPRSGAAGAVVSQKDDPRKGDPWKRAALKGDSRKGDYSLPSLLSLSVSLPGLSDITEDEDTETETFASCRSSPAGPSSPAASGSSAGPMFLERPANPVPRFLDLLVDFTMEELDAQRFNLLQETIAKHRELAELHRHSREGFRFTGTEDVDRHLAKKRITRGAIGFEESRSREIGLRGLEENLAKVERLIRLRGGLNPKHDQAFLRSRSLSSLYARHFVLWQRYDALLQRKVDLQFVLGALDGAYRVEELSAPTAETRKAVVKYIVGADEECGCLGIEMDNLEKIMQDK